MLPVPRFIHPHCEPVPTTPDLVETLARDGPKAARLYARFGATEELS